MGSLAAFEGPVGGLDTGLPPVLLASWRLGGIAARGGGHGRRGGARDELVAEHGFDTKYAMHCARLGFQCVELLTTGRLTLPIEGEPADWLRSVGRGEVTFSYWWNRALELDRRLEALERDKRYRAGPDASTIDRWTIATHQDVWAELR